MEPNFKNGKNEKKLKIKVEKKNIYQNNYLESGYGMKNGEWRNAMRYSECVAVLFYLFLCFILFSCLDFGATILTSGRNGNHATTRIVRRWTLFCSRSGNVMLIHQRDDLSDYENSGPFYWPNLTNVVLSLYLRIL